MKKLSNYFLKTQELDIHNMMELEALKFLEKKIISLHKLKYRRIIVIHGYKHGRILKNMVLVKLRSNLIKSRTTNVFNQGETEIILKDKR